MYISTRFAYKNYSPQKSFLREFQRDEQHSHLGHATDILQSEKKQEKSIYYRNRLLRSHTEKSSIASYYRQFSTKTKVKSWTENQFCWPLMQFTRCFPSRTPQTPHPTFYFLNDLKKGVTFSYAVLPSTQYNLT